MPARWWKHDCPCGESERTEEVCEACGAVGADFGWRMTEEDRDQVFMWGTGLARPAADDTSAPAEALRRRLAPCTVCEETGLLQPDGPKDAWAWCPRCHGMGSALDGCFVIEPPGRDIAYAIAPRAPSTGYMHRYRPGRSVRRDLDEVELAALHAWLRDRGFHQPAPMVPAVVCEDTGRMAVGPSYAAMLGRDGMVRSAFDDLNHVCRGFIDLSHGQFLTRESAAERMRWSGLLDERVVLLHPERLPWYADVPCGVVRWEGIVAEE